MDPFAITMTWVVDYIGVILPVVALSGVYFGWRLRDSMGGE